MPREWKTNFIVEIACMQQFWLGTMIHVSKRADTARKFPQPVWRTHVTCLQKPCSRLDTHATGTREVIKLPKLTYIISNALTYTEGKCAHTLEKQLVCLDGKLSTSFSSEIMW